MEITWHGLGCFSLSERGYPTIVTDPFDPSETGLLLPRAAVDVVTWSALLEDPQEASWPGLRAPVPPGKIHTLASPGEYEIGGAFITAIASLGAGQDVAAQNIVYTVNCGGIVVGHLGRMVNTPSQALVEAIGRVNVLLVPVGLSGGLTMAMASETVRLVEPDIVVPMQYRTPDPLVERDGVEGFLKEMGVTQPVVMPSLKVTAGAEPEETQIVLLELNV
jgi:L-ascorbate metabolism protein UlaG (beta-lactamase superfamily)